MVEFLVYLCVFSCISICLMQFIVNSVMQLRSYRVELNHTLHLLTALDLIAQEIAHAPALKTQWHATERNSIIWHSTVQNKDICLCIMDKKLVRIKGNYRPNSHTWKSKKTNVLVDNVEDFILDYQWGVQTHEQLNLITCSIVGFVNKNKLYTACRSIALHNGYC